jgi:hypothetical protein
MIAKIVASATAGRGQPFALHPADHAEIDGFGTSFGALAVERAAAEPLRVQGLDRPERAPAPLG